MPDFDPLTILREIESQAETLASNIESAVAQAFSAAGLTPPPPPPRPARLSDILANLQTLTPAEPPRIRFERGRIELTAPQMGTPKVEDSVIEEQPNVTREPPRASIGVEVVG